MARTRISGDGCVTNGEGNGTGIAPDGSNTGFLPYQQPTTTPTSTTFTVTPGLMYVVSGSTQCTATLPAPGSYPGSMVMFTLSNAQPAMLTGSATSPNTNVFQAMPSNKLGSSNSYGTKCTLASNGSIALFSDGYYWTPFVASGSITLA